MGFLQNPMYTLSLGRFRAFRLGVWTERSTVFHPVLHPAALR